MNLGAPVTLLIFDDEIFENPGLIVIKPSFWDNVLMLSRSELFELIEFKI